MIKIKLFSTFLVIIIILSCNNQPTTMAHTPCEDSLNKVRLYLDTARRFSIKSKKFYSSNSFSLSPSPIPIDSAREMTRAYYRPAFQLGITNSDGEELKGFVLDKNDFLRIAGPNSRYKSLAIYFAIKNFTQVERGANPEYTLIFVPILDDGTQDGRADIANSYDYVLPCPRNCPGGGY